MKIKKEQEMKFKNRISGKIKYLLLLLPIGIHLSQKPFPKTIFEVNEMETFRLNQRRSLYPNKKIARFFENKATQVVYRFKKNFFDGLDINLYFFATHPRERPNISEKERFNWVFVLPFLFGIFYQVKKKIYWPTGYFLINLLLISFFVQIEPYLLLLYPFVILAIFLGIYNLLKESVKIF